MVKKGNLLIIGAGGYGRLAKEIATQTGAFNKIDFLDDFSGEAVGTVKELAEFTEEYEYAFVAIGNAGCRRELITRLKACGYKIITLLHPQSYVSPSAKLGDGCCVEPLAVVHTGASVGDGCFVCAGAMVNHDAEVGAYCQVDCNATVSARACVPPETKIEHGVVFKNEAHE